VNGPAEGPPDLPRKAYVELTTACNLDCPMCIRQEEGFDHGEMSGEAFAAVLRGAAAMPSLRTVNFSGYGEPTMHGRFWDFLRRAKAAGLAAEAVTNAALLGRPEAAGLVEAGLDRLVVSLDGVGQAGGGPPLHATSLARVAGFLQALRDERLMRRAPGPTVCIEFVATRSNVDQLPRLAALSLPLGFEELLVTNLIPRTAEQARQVLYGLPATASRGGAASPARPWVDLPLMDAFSPGSAAAERLRRMGMALRVNGAPVAGRGPRCPFVAEGRFAIRWDGAVSPCLPLLHGHGYFYRDRPRRVRAFTVGSVNASPLAALWRSSAWRGFRARVRRWEFSPCIDCGACDLRDTNERDCTGERFPRCGECLWAAGLVQCP